MISRFGPFQYDWKAKVLMRDGTLIELEPKTVQTLEALLRRRGEEAKKQELIEEIWPDTIVQENNLAHHIYLLKTAFGEEYDFIETVHARLYVCGGCKRLRTNLFHRGLAFRG
jgi:DNA-binding winged helix-turn-helix (wHTH) protein